MNFDTVNSNPCIVSGAGSGANGSGGGSGGSSGGGSADSRCLDSTFAAANPSICGSAPYLVLKPSSTIISKLGSVQFDAFLYTNGVESLLSSGLTFGSSDTTTLVVGASSGAATGLAAGTVVVTAAYKGYTATASVTVLDSTIGCNDTHVKTAIVIDCSKSMSLQFGSGYQTRLSFAGAVASSYAGTITQVGMAAKDSVKIWSFSDIPTQVSTDFISDTTTLLSDISSVTQTTGGTDLAGAITAAANDLITATADEKVLLLITDGEQTDAPTAQDVVDAATMLKSVGGTIIVIGVRAAGSGFDLLEHVATGGFFINAFSSNAAVSLGGLSYLKSSVCAGSCTPAGDVWAATAELDYSSFVNWSVVSGQVNLLGNGFMDFCPGNGLYVELASSNNPATIESIDSYPIESGSSYSIQFMLAGNNQLYTPTASPSVLVYIRDVNAAAGDPNLFEQVVTANWNQCFQPFSFSFAAQYSTSIRIYFKQQQAAGYTGAFAGNLLDGIKFVDETTLSTLLQDDFDTEHEVYTPPGCGPSAAIPVLANPVEPTGIAVAASNGGFGLGSVKYAISYTTNEGETGLSQVMTVSFLSATNYCAWVTPQSLPDISSFKTMRVWRTIASGASALYLFAEYNSDSIPAVIIDCESFASFSARYSAIPATPSSNTTGATQGQLGSGVAGCYEAACEPSIPLGVQSPDPAPLSNIESAGSTTVVNSTQQVCQSCTAGSTLVNFQNTITQSTMTPTSDGAMWDFGSALLLDKFCFTFGAVAGGPTLTLSVVGSSDGITWIPVPINPTFYNGSFDQPVVGTVSGNSISISTSGGIPASCVAFGVVQFQYFKIVFDKSKWTLNLASIETLVINVDAQICKSATASASTQSDADYKATQAATQAVQAALATQCLSSWTSTKQHTAVCPCGTAGQSITKSVTYTSYQSQSDAEAQAQALATAQANAELVCTSSTNTQQTVIPTTAGAASPYPSVQYVTGFVGNSTSISLKLTGIECGDFSSFDILLMNPAGVVCAIKADAGQPGGILHSTPNSYDLTFVDSAASGLPNNALPTRGGSYKPTQGGALTNLGGCVPHKPWQVTLNALAGSSPNGAWSLWCQNENGPFGGSINGWELTIS